VRTQEVPSLNYVKVAYIYVEKQWRVRVGCALVLLKPCWVYAMVVLGLSWGHLGLELIFGHLGALYGDLETRLRQIGAILGHLWHYWTHVGQKDEQR
jgi:hypothetical protein